MTNYLNAEPDHRRLEIGGTWYRKSVQRSHVNTECKLLLLSHAFDALHCRESALAAAPLDPLTFLQAVMREPTADPRLRVDCAKAAAHFVHSKPGAAKPEDRARIIEGRSAWSQAEEAQLQDLRAQRDVLHGQHLASARAGQPFDPGEGDQLGDTIFELERGRPYSKEEVDAMNREREGLGLGEARFATEDVRLGDRVRA
jgi:hypothetical protein